MIAAGPAKVEKTPLEEGPRRNLYPVLTAPSETAFRERVELAQRADRAARAYDPRVFQVQVAYADNLRQVLVATSDGMLNYDRQPMTRMSVFVLARDKDGVPQQGHAGGGGRHELDWFRTYARPNISRRKRRVRPLCNWARWMPRRASRSWCWGRAGPASCCMKPSATVSKPISTAKAFRRFPGASASRSRARSAPSSTTAPSAAAAVRSTSMTRAIETQRNVLIENGILRGYLQDKLSSRITGAPANRQRAARKL